MSRRVVQIWSPQDSVDTAQEFHLELANAERGVPERKSRLFSVSRERKARRMDALAVALLLIVMAAFGCIVMLLSTPQAKADPATEAYADIYGPVVCQVLNEHATVYGVLGVGQGISEESGFTPEQAGEVIGYSVATYCPQHMGLLKRFVAVFSSAETKQLA